MRIRVLFAVVLGSLVAACAGGDPSTDTSAGAVTDDGTRAPVAQRATETWSALDGSWARILGDYAALNFEKTTCGGGDAPFCFTGALADGTVIHGGYAVIGDVLMLRYGTTTRFLRFDPTQRGGVPTGEDATMNLYDGHTLVASLHRVAKPCTTDCAPFVWSTE